jgi:hypothetical protein
METPQRRCFDPRECRPYDDFIGAMQRISSRATFYQKRVFPVIWFGFLAFFLLTAARVKTPGNRLPIAAIVIPVFMGAFGYFLMKKLVFDLADEVQDAGDALIVRFGTQEERIPLSEIINVSYSYLSNPARVTLTLRTPGRFGKEVSFSPPSTFLPFVKSPIVADLIERSDAARRR